ncbi:MAG: glutamate 5-kinase [Elusimicrobiota bacterium]
MRIVIKIGTRLLTKTSGVLDEKNISRLVKEIGELLDKGIEVIIVSSGAIGAGCGSLKCKPQNLSLREKQAAASIGQTDLINSYRNSFSKQKRVVGQILVTAQDFARRRSYLNIRNTIFTLLKMKVVPIINENDTVAVEEIKFGDNDHLAAVITSKVDADKFIILTDVDGLITSEGKLIKQINKIDKKTEQHAGTKGSEFGVGGMISKIKAAKITAQGCGIDTYIANGREKGVLSEIINNGNPGSLFKGQAKDVSQKKRWIAFGTSPSGSIVLDKGAVEALINRNSSLLSVGISKVKGEFKQGDSVDCVDEQGNLIARGLVNYNSDDIEKIKGKKSSQIDDILGYKDYDEIIHRDNLVLL